MATLGMGTGRLTQGNALATLQRRCTARAPRRPSQSDKTLAVQRHCLGSPRQFSSNSGKRPRFSQRLGEALRNTKIQWYQIPVGLGIGFLGLVQFYKVSSREREKAEADGTASSGRPAPRPRVRPDGPW